MSKLINRLAKLDPKDRLLSIAAEVKEEQQKKNPNFVKIDKLIHEKKILHNLQDNNLSPVEAFTQKYVPVIEARFRSPIELPGGTVQLPDINLLLRDIGIANNTLKRSKGLVSNEELSNLKKNLYKSVAEMQGFVDPRLNPEVTKNPFREYAGDIPKKGFFQKNVTKKRQNLSGRSVIVPDTSLDIDHISMPYKMGLEMYSPFITKELISQGFTNREAKDEIKKGGEKAKAILREEGKKRPVVMNRAPSIWSGSVTGHLPVFTDKKTIGIPNLLTPYQLADFDGDKVGIHVPVTDAGVNDVMKMLPSKTLMSEGTNSLIPSPSHAAVTGLYLLSKTSQGKEKINNILPDEFKTKEVITKKVLKNLLTNIEKTRKYDTAKIIDKLRRVGDQNAYDKSVTLTLSDVIPAEKERAEVLKEIETKISKLSNKNDQKKLTEIYRAGANDLTAKIKKRFANIDNSMGDMLLSGSRGSASQFRDVVGSPIAVMSGELIDIPIKHSYSEGLSPAEMFITAKGARLGVMGRSQETALPGALANEVLATTNQIVINDDKNEYMKAISIDIKNKDDVLDRISATTIKNKDGDILIKKDEPVTLHSVQQIEKAGIDKIKVYTPLGSSAPDGSIAKKSYGLTAKGELPTTGTNIGIISGHTIVKPLFDGSMASFHTGSSLDDKLQGYPRIKQLTELPKILPSQATLAATNGTISDIVTDSIGGHTFKIQDKKHYVLPGNKMKVNKGDSVNKGDILSSGPVNPKELAEKKSLEAAQEYMVEELKLQAPGARRRAIETIVESITRHAKIIDPGDTDLMHGDVELINKIEEKNKEAKRKAKYSYLFKGVNTLPQDTQDWLSNLNFRNLKRTLEKNTAIGAKAPIHSFSPIPALAMGTEFGKGQKGKY